MSPAISAAAVIASIGSASCSGCTRRSAPPAAVRAARVDPIVALRAE
jgi:hypothetical protein